MKIYTKTLLGYLGTLEMDCYEKQKRRCGVWASLGVQRKKTFLKQKLFY